MTNENGMRASDRDRERAAEALRGAYAAGRLDLSEFHERADAVCSARTWGKLRDLTADLPEGEALGRAGLAGGAGGERGGPGGERGDGAGGARHDPARPFLPMVMMAAIWLAIAAVGHVAAAIPLVLLSAFVLAAACWKMEPPQPPGEPPPGSQATEAARPGTRAQQIPARHEADARVPPRSCSLPRRGSGRCPRPRR